MDTEANEMGTSAATTQSAVGAQPVAEQPANGQQTGNRQTAQQQPNGQQANEAQAGRQQTGGQSSGGQGGGASTGTGQAPDLMTLLEQSPMPKAVCQWVRCLRAPAMSLRYDVEKRHIPNRDTAQQNTDTAAGTESDTATESAVGTGNRASAGQSGQSTATASSQSASRTSASQATPGAMRYTGQCTVRYFDLAVGALALMMLGCMMRCCSCLRRKMGC